MNKILKPVVVQLKTFIKDEFDFIRKFPKNVRNDCYVLCCDVTSLYTSIPTELGIKALEYWLDKLSFLIPDRFTKAFIIESIRFILENNFFMFDADIWHQLIGTAMGKSFAPPYACLTMGYLEETVFIPILIPSKFDITTTKLIIDFFFRFIDDGIMLLPKNVSPVVFLEILNSMNSSIQYTITLPTVFEVNHIISQTINFLSINIIITSDGLVKTDVYYKETNAHDYLAFDSHHPRHTKENIPFVLAKRIIIITSEDEWVKRNLSDLRTYLIARKYPINVIEKGIHNASLQGPAPKPSCEKIIPLITPYFSNYDSTNIVGVARDLIDKSKNSRVNDAFKSTKFIQCYRQPQNTLQILSNSRFISQTRELNKQKPAGISHCTHKSCKICKLYLQKCTSFVTSNGSEWEIKCHATCNSMNVVYYLICNF